MKLEHVGALIAVCAALLLGFFAVTHVFPIDRLWRSAKPELESDGAGAS